MPRAKKKPTTLGRAVINSRESITIAGRAKRPDTTNLMPPQLVPKKVEASIVEESSVEEFLSKATLAGTVFDADHSNVKIISASTNNKLVGSEKSSTSKNSVLPSSDRLRIPRRPKWNDTMTPEELEKLENESFLEWRRELAKVEQEEGTTLTPFERNLEIWRQLWRVLERSDIVIQIIDARNPLLFRCRDLETYVKELSPNKVPFLLINKADLLSRPQRCAWAEYLHKQGVKFAFWSAVDLELDKLTLEEKEESDVESSSSSNASSSSELADNEGESDLETENDSDEDSCSSDSDSESISDKKPDIWRSSLSGVIMNRTQLFDLFYSLLPEKTEANEMIVVGMVGYPNVGKSSTVNKLIGNKRVAVSATPGKTKHFQTIPIDDTLMLCDCPGLVMPSFAFSKAQMTINGILPPDEMREHVPAIELICSQLKQSTFERMYGVCLPPNDRSDDHTTASDLLISFAFVRGFMSAKGIPDQSRAARIIVKDYVNGKLRYCCAPPTVDQEKFNSWSGEVVVKEMSSANAKNEILGQLNRRHLLERKIQQSELDKEFFKERVGAAHVKGVVGMGKLDPTAFKAKRHNNRNKREKLRRIYAHLDV